MRNPIKERLKYEANRLFYNKQSQKSYAEYKCFTNKKIIDKECVKTLASFLRRCLYKEANRAKIKTKNREYTLRRRNSVRKHYYKRKDFVYKVLGGAKCVRCGFTDKRALQLDHVLGDGYKQRKKGNGLSGAGIMQDVIKNPKKYQILCANCNWIKRFENNEYRKTY